MVGRLNEEVMIYRTSHAETELIYYTKINIKSEICLTFGQFDISAGIIKY